MTITDASTAASKAVTKPTSEETTQGRFERILFVVGMMFFAVYRHNPIVHNAVQPFLHALVPFLF